MSSFTIGNYYPGNSLIHRLDPRVKLGFSLVLMIIVFFLNKPVPLALYGAGITSLIFLAKIDLRTVWRTVKPILFITSFAFVLNMFSVPGKTLIEIAGPLKITAEGLQTGVLMAVRLIFLIIGSSILMTLTTTSLLLADSVESLLAPLKTINVPVHDISMMISIALRFIPTLADEADKIRKAQSSRGANYDTGGFMQRIRGLVTILIPLFVSAIKRADELATAMESRCYRGGEGRTKLNQLHMKARDIIFLVMGLVVVTGILVVQFAF